jgi:hypothetical protein
MADAGLSAGVGAAGEASEPLHGVPAGTAARRALETGPAHQTGIVSKDVWHHVLVSG